MQPGRLLPRPKISLIVKIHTIGDRFESSRRPHLFHDLKEFVFALKATLAIIANIIGAIEFRCLDDLNRKTLLFGESNRIHQLSASQARRIGDDRQHLVTEFAVGRPGKICRIHAAGISDQHSAQSP